MSAEARCQANRGINAAVFRKQKKYYDSFRFLQLLCVHFCWDGSIIFDDDLMDRLADALLEHLHKENDTLPILQKQFAETQKSIDNMLNAIQQGIFTTSTKERLEALEREKSELSVQIMKEELSRPNLTKEQILFWIHKFRKLNPKKLEHRRRLINSFLNSVYLFDDKIIIDCNYKDGTETITFEEIENSALGSDLRSLAAPYRVFITCMKL